MPVLLIAETVKRSETNTCAGKTDSELDRKGTLLKMLAMIFTYDNLPDEDGQSPPSGLPEFRHSPDLLSSRTFKSREAARSVK